MESEPLRPRSHLFTVRLGLEPLGDGQTEWRGKVQHLPSGEAQYIRGWPALQGETTRWIAQWTCRAKSPISSAMALAWWSQATASFTSCASGSTPTWMPPRLSPSSSSASRTRNIGCSSRTFKPSTRGSRSATPSSPLTCESQWATSSTNCGWLGLKATPFPEGFVTVANQSSHVVPRQLNRVCLNGLLIGFTDRKHVLDESDAKRAIQELGRPS